MFIAALMIGLFLFIVIASLILAYQSRHQDKCPYVEHAPPYGWMYPDGNVVGLPSRTIEKVDDKTFVKPSGYQESNVNVVPDSPPPPPSVSSGKIQTSHELLHKFEIQLLELKRENHKLRDLLDVAFDAGQMFGQYDATSPQFRIMSAPMNKEQFLAKALAEV